MRREGPFPGDLASMHRLTTFSPAPSASLLLAAAIAACASLAAGCGGKKPPETPDAKTGEAKADGEGDGIKPSDPSKADGDKAGGDKAGGEKAPKKDECVGFEIGNLDELLSKSACEEPNAKPDGLPPVDLKGKLEVTITASPTKVAPGAKADLYVSFINKSKEPITLHFRIDPVPRFEVEAYDAKKNQRVDMPAGKPPPPPKGSSAPPSSEAKSARVTLTPNGSAKVKLPWEAVKTKWAPEKVRGTPPERGYPRSPAGPLAKGKLILKVVTPLVGVNEGGEKEFSVPKLELEVGG